MSRRGTRRVVVVGPHPPEPTAAARLSARLAAEHLRAGAVVLTVDRRPSAAARTLSLQGVPGALAVACLALRADRLELVLVPGLVQRPGARTPEHRAVAAAWRAALGVPRVARVHVLDPVDRVQLGVDGRSGPVVVVHAADVDRSVGTPPVAEADPTWASFAATVAVRAAADRLAGLALRLPPALPPPRSRNQDVVDHLRARYGRQGEIVVQAGLGAKRLGRAALAAARRR